MRRWQSSAPEGQAQVAEGHTQVATGNLEAEVANGEGAPVLFVQKYNCMLDVEHVSEERLSTEQKASIIAKAAKETDSLPTMLARLSPEASPASTPTRGPARQAGLIDEDVVKNSQLMRSELTLHPSIETEMALWQTVPKLDVRQWPSVWLGLSKARLTALVCSTAAAGYGMATTAAPFDPLTFAASTAGVGLISAAANTINQYLEVPFDSQMNRTKNRALVRHTVSPLHAATFALASASAGTLLMAMQVNALAAALGVFNLFLYTSVYTPMKRVSIVNTWIGSVVGAVPPLIGWAACTGSLEPAAFILAGILFTWQFPHFNSLSWNLRPDYSRAGYRMMSVTHPELCRRVAMRHSIACQALCVLAPLADLTEPAFALEALTVNAVLIYLAWDFKRKADSESSRRLFRFTLIHLPILMTLMFVNKKKRRKKVEKGTS